MGEAGAPLRPPRALEPRPGVDLGPLLGPRLAGTVLGWQHAPLVAAYAGALRWCVLTAGAPRAAAEAAAWAQLRAEGAATAAAAAAVEIGSEVGEGLLGGVAAGAGAPGLPEELPEGTALPPHFLPGFWAVFCLVAVGLLHCLLVLIQHWSVRARCLVRYREARELRAGGFALVPPADAHRGKPEIVPVVAGRPSCARCSRQWRGYSKNMPSPKASRHLSRRLNCESSTARTSSTYRCPRSRNCTSSSCCNPFPFS